MKILIVSEFFPNGKELKFSGGVEARNFYLARELAKKHSITILTSKTNDAKNNETMFNIRILRVGPVHSYQPTAGSILTRLIFIKDAIKIGKNIDADIVDGTNFITHLIAKQISIQKKIPVVAWYPDVWLGKWLENVGLVGIFGEVLERINIARDFDSYIAISKSTAQKLKTRTKKKIHIIPCGVDETEFFLPVNKVQDTIICISRLAKYKRIKTLILAFALLSKTRKNLRLKIIGSGPDSKNLKSLTDNLNLSDKISFSSNLSRKELVESLKSSQIFCLPSEVEGFGISVIEAACAKVPYVISNINVFREITKNGQGGLLFKLNDPFDMAQKIKKLLSNKKLYGQKIKEGLELSKNYKWPKIASLTEDVYSNVCK